MARGRYEKVVNLDALIERGDLYENLEDVPPDWREVRITDLEPGPTYSLMRKPDFQRETANWSPGQVVDLIETFCASEIIPAVILWQGGNRLFVIDGAHRLSALIGWVRNDFGAGEASRKFFGHQVRAQQKAMHDETLSLLGKSVKSYAEFKASNPLHVLKPLEIQWIKGRTPQQAAKAFIRINRGGTEIDDLEVRILNAARSALSVATRVISRGGSGHAYWDHFADAEAKRKTPAIGAEIYKLLYEPELEYPIKSHELPLGGPGYGMHVIRLAFDLVAVSNELSVSDSTRSNSAEKLLDDNEGTTTLNYLNRTLKTLRLILSNDPSSLGLHPALWFYSETGAFRSVALINVISWVKHLQKTNRFDAFRKHRGKFENLLLAHPSIIKPAVHTLGSGTRTRATMKTVLDRTLDLILENEAIEDAWYSLAKAYPTLAKAEEDRIQNEEKGRRSSSFDVSVKNAASLADLAHAPRCAICDGFLHRNGKVLDHIEKKADGGRASRANARWVHPVCNSNRDKDERLHG